ncbi:hypothetical protein ACE939_00990 [Aquimarina sp. W85]|uniref:hypothetical protein n=1 Tax=Aquimarina rhodophyticola TaxID=3342246 RepID=UPI0036733E31
MIFFRIVLSLVMVSTVVYAQNDTHEHLKTELHRSQFEQLQIATDFDNKSISSNANYNSAVFIKQVGETNTAFIDVLSNSYNIEINQTGTYNHVDIEEAALQISKKITQEGNYNSYIDNSYSNTQFSVMDLSQEGDNLYFEKFGSNSLSDKIKLKMTGTSKTIILRNFN